MVAILLCRLGWASILYLTSSYCFRQTFSFKCKLAIFGFNQSVLSKHVKKIHVASWLWKWELYTVFKQLWGRAIMEKDCFVLLIYFQKVHTPLSNSLCMFKNIYLQQKGFKM